MDSSSLKYPNQCFINGEYVPSIRGEMFQTLSPHNGELITDVSAGTGEDIDRAVQSAREAFNDGRWRNKPPREKMKIMFRLAELIQANGDELSLMESMDTGKPIRYSKSVDVHHGVSCFQYYGEAIDKIYGQVANTPEHAIGMVTREPIGVVGAITPWNFPLMMSSWKVAPALAVGNSVLLKPAEQTPLTALRLAELAIEAGIPEGVFNVVPGLGETAGKSLALHMDVDCISFTGSTEVAKLLLQYSGQSNMKRVSAETGGKSPNIIFEDAYDLAFTAKQAAFGIYYNTGAMCVAGSRLLVQEGIKEQVQETLVSMAGKMTPGDPMDQDTRVGPVIDKPQFDKINHYIAKGQEEGANLVFGGKTILEESGGHYIQPTVFDGVNNEMTIARDEIFGPVVSVIPFKDEADALRIANDTNYGLNAGIWTRDIARAHRMAKGVQAGTVWVNNWEGSNYSVPFGGFKQSGFGGKDKSLHALDKYTNVKSTWIHIAGRGVES